MTRNSTTLSTLKKCPRCGLEKTQENFHPSKTRKSGISCWCIDCTRYVNREYQKNNRSKANERNTRYYKSEKGKISASKHNKTEKRKAVKRKYNQSPKGRESSKRCCDRRRKLLKTLSNTLTSAEWENIITTQDNKCYICKKIFNNKCILDRAEKDHIIPLSRGGPTTRQNIRAVCRSCNSVKGDRDFTDQKFNDLVHFEEGLPSHTFGG